MYEVILSNGDRAEAETPDAVLYAAHVLRREAVAAGCNPRIARGTIVTKDEVYDAKLTNLAQSGATTCS